MFWLRKGREEGPLFRGNAIERTEKEHEGVIFSEIEE